MMAVLILFGLIITVLLIFFVKLTIEYIHDIKKHSFKFREIKSVEFKEFIQKNIREVVFSNVLYVVIAICFIAQKEYLYTLLSFLVFIFFISFSVIGVYCGQDRESK